MDGSHCLVYIRIQDTKGRAVGSAGRCRCVFLSRFIVGAMMLAVVSKGASA